MSLTSPERDTLTSKKRFRCLSKYMSSSIRRQLIKTLRKKSMGNSPWNNSTGYSSCCKTSQPSHLLSKQKLLGSQWVENSLRKKAYWTILSTKKLHRGQTEFTKRSLWEFSRSTSFGSMKQSSLNSIKKATDKTLDFKNYDRVSSKERRSRASSQQGDDSILRWDLLRMNTFWIL